MFSIEAIFNINFYNIFTIPRWNGIIIIILRPVKCNKTTINSLVSLISILKIFPRSIWKPYLWYCQENITPLAFQNFLCNSSCKINSFTIFKLGSSSHTLAAIFQISSSFAAHISLKYQIKWLWLRDISGNTTTNITFICGIWGPCVSHRHFFALQNFTTYL